MQDCSYILGNLQINTVAQLRSGQPYTVNVPGDIANIGVSGGYGRPNLVGNPMLVPNLGQTLEAVGRYKDAIAAWQQAVAVDPTSAEAVYALSQALQTEDPVAAAQMQEKFRTLQAEREEADRASELGNQGYAAMQEEQWSTAIGAFQKAIVVCKHCVFEAALHQRLGLAEYRSGDLDAEEKELQPSLALNPNDRTTLSALKSVDDQRKLRQDGR